jgi:dihydrodipicolinate synthase/N-acetylneuraminate lyase
MKRLEVSNLRSGRQTMKAEDIAGIIPAVVVPMDEQYAIDFRAYRRYLSWIVGLKPVGVAVNVDTGEGSYLTSDERAEVIRVTKEVAGSRCRVIAGCGGPATAMAVANARVARDAGADGLLVFPTPAFLNDPLDPRIVYDYHKAIAEASGLPILMFQLAPLFGGCNYTPEALRKTLSLPQVIGLKDASFDAMRFSMARDMVQSTDHKVTLLTGNDNFLLESFLLGAEGGLLGYGAVGVELLIAMLDAVKKKEFDRAAAMQPRVQGFCDYIYGHPIGDYRARCKVALVHMGLIEPRSTYVRPPYLSLWDQEKERARRVVEQFNVVAVEVAHRDR